MRPSIRNCEMEDLKLRLYGKREKRRNIIRENCVVKVYQKDGKGYDEKLAGYEKKRTQGQCVVMRWNKRKLKM